MNSNSLPPNSKLADKLIGLLSATSFEGNSWMVRGVGAIIMLGVDRGDNRRRMRKRNPEAGIIYKPA